MISEWFLGLLAMLAEWFLGLFPSSPELEGFATDAGSVIQDALDSAQGLGAWLDWAYALTVAGIVAGVWVVGLLIKVVRWLLGLVPTMGGGT